jgi:hypothetical protein
VNHRHHVTASSLVRGLQALAAIVAIAAEGRQSKQVGTVDNSTKKSSATWFRIG